jgi:PAS domain S-box-containing protein
MGDITRAGWSRVLWPAKHRRQYVVAVAVLLAGGMLSSAVFFTIRHQERDHIHRDFDRAAQDRIYALKKSLDLDFLLMRCLRSFYDGSNAVERKEFSWYAVPLIADHPGIRALQWAPRVRDGERSKYEEAAARDGIRTFRISEYSPRNRLSPASPRKEYFPVFFVEPAHGNVAALGIDLATIPACREAMNQSCDTGEVTATNAFRLPGESAEQLGCRLFLSVYLRNAPLRTVEERRNGLQGFAVGVLRVNGMVNEGMAGLAPVGIDLQLFDSTDPDKERVLCTYRSPLWGSDAAASEEMASLRESEFRSVDTLDVGGRRWTVLCAAIPQFIAARMTWYPWVGAIVVLLLSGLLATYLFGIAIQYARTTRLAVQLTDANQQLWKEIADREQAEATLYASEVKYKTIYDASSDAIMYASPEIGMLSGNPAAVAMFGCKDEKEFTSQSPASLSPTYQPDGSLSSAKAQQMMAIAMEAGSNLFEWKHKRSDGSEFFASVLLTRMELDGQRFMLSTVRDITAQKQAEELKTRSLRRLGA